MAKINFGITVSESDTDAINIINEFNEILLSDKDFKKKNEVLKSLKLYISKHKESENYGR